jgi:dihydroorotase
MLELPSMLVLRAGRVLDPRQGRDRVDDDAIADVVIEDGRVSRVGRGAAEDLPASSTDRVEVIDCAGRWVTPGFIDLHVHLREPGQEYKEDIASGLAAAAAGGFTAVCAMPNTRPVNDRRSITEAMLARAREVGGARLHVFGAVTMGSAGEQLTEMGDLREAGAIGVSDDGVCVRSSAVMRRALEYARTFDLLVSQHCEDHDLTVGAQMNEGPVSTRLGLRGWPREAEDIIVARDLILAEMTGARYHVAHLSSRGSVRLVREAKARGLAVSAEVTPHHLLLTDEAVVGYRTFCKVNPPLRSAEDVEAVREALRDGTIDCIATDHAPHSTLEKDCEFDASSFGILGLEPALATLLGLVRDGHLSPSRLVESLAAAPARVGRLEGGSLAVGERADLAIVDPELEWVLRREDLRSKSHNTPYLDQPMKGAVTHTVVSGEVVYERAPLR